MIPISRLALALLLAGCSSTQQVVPPVAAPAATEDRASPATRIDAQALLRQLVEQTNALEGFTARYRMTTREGEVVEVTFSYAAPDRGSMLVANGANYHRTVVVGERLVNEARGDQDFHEFASLDVQALFAEIELISDRLEHEFPGTRIVRNRPLRPGAIFEWQWTSPSPGERSAMDFAVGADSNRTCVCGWLNSLAKRPELPIELEDSLVWRFEGGEVVELSKTTGFIRLQQRENDSGPRAGIVLLGLELRAPTNDMTFAVPDSPPPGARDASAEYERHMREIYLFQTRASIWSRLARALEEGHETWDEHSPEKLVRVFRTWHALSYAEIVRSSMEQWRKTTDTFAEQLSSSIEKLEPDDERGREKLSEQRDLWFAGMEKDLDVGFDRIQALKLPDGVDPKARWSDEFLRGDRAAAHAEFEKLVRAPLIEYFEQETDAALARK